MQMTQFVMVFVHGVQLIFSNPCGYSVILSYAVIAHAIMFFFLFRGELFVWREFNRLIVLSANKQELSVDSFAFVN